MKSRMVCIRLPAELYDYIEKQATEKKMLVSEVARNIIRDTYISREETPDIQTNIPTLKSSKKIRKKKIKFDYICYKCGEGFKRQKELIEHLIAIHNYILNE